MVKKGHSAHIQSVLAFGKKSIVKLTHLYNKVLLGNKLTNNVQYIFTVFTNTYVTTFVLTYDLLLTITIYT